MAEHGKFAQFVHRQCRRASTAVGQATADLRMLPDFLVIGAQRCGTTSFYELLGQHPAILSAGLHKGVHYFDTAYQRGPRWYRAHFPTTLTAERAQRRAGTRAITGEASPYYLFHPLAPSRIAADLSEVKVIALLRDPVERAYSAHAHESARGFETEPFARALELEESRLSGEEQRLIADPTYVSRAHQHQAYVARGRYVEQLQRYEAALGRERVYVIDFDDLFAHITTGFGEVLDFLGVPRWSPPQVEQRNARPRSRLDDELRERLREAFAEDDARLATWWGRTPSWRR